MSQYPHACLMQATGARRRCEAERLVNAGLYLQASAMMEEAAVYLTAAHEALPESAVAWREALERDVEALHDAQQFCLWESGHQGEC